MFSQECPSCKAKIKKGDAFCGHCGARVGGATIKCGHCGAEIDSGSKFCGHCGQSLDTAQAPRVVGRKWARRPDDFATRIEIEDLEGLFKRELTVEAGTIALLYIDGRLAGTLRPGRHTLAGLKDVASFVPASWKHPATAVLVDAGDVGLDFTVAGLKTSDPLFIEVACNLVLQITEPGLFFVNLMKGQPRFSLSRLNDFLADEVRDALGEAIGAKSAVDLSSNLSLKREFEVAVENHVRKTFERLGLSLVQFRTISYVHPHFDAIHNLQEKLYLQVSEDEAKLAGRKRLFDVVREEELQGVAEQAARAEIHEKRAEIFSRMRRAVNSDKMDEVKSEEDLAAFMLEVDKSRLLRDEELAELKRTFAENREDHEVARQHLVAKIKLEQELEYERLRLIGTEETDRDLSQMRLDRKRAELEKELAIAALAGAQRREEEIRDQQAELTRRLQAAKTQAEVAVIEREQDRLDSEMGLATLERTQAIERKDERERMLLDLERREREMGLEIERLKSLSGMSMEAIISVSGPEQAAILGDLQKTQILKDYSAEQILAMATEKSPEVARAFEEKFKAAPHEKIEQLYQQMMADKDKSAAEMVQTVKDMFKDLTEVTKTSLQAGHQPPPVVYPPPGAGYPPTGVVYTSPGQPGGAEPRMVKCPKCGQAVPLGQRYCNKCRHKMFDE